MKPEELKKLVKEIRQIANNLPKGHGWKRRHEDRHQKTWGMPKRRKR